MNAEVTSTDLGIASRIRRSRGRMARNKCLGVKLTQDEAVELESAAASSGKAAGEWARDVLLHHTRSGAIDTAVLTELLAMRMFVNQVLRSVVLGKSMTEAEYTRLLAEVKTNKHGAASDVLKQYRDESGGQ